MALVVAGVFPWQIEGRGQPDAEGFTRREWAALVEFINERSEGVE